MNMKLIAGFAVIVALLSGWGVISMAQSSKISVKEVSNQSTTSKNILKDEVVDNQAQTVKTSVKIYDPKESEKKVNTIVKIAE